MVQTLYSTGNINLHQPHSVFASAAHPVSYFFKSQNGLNFCLWFVNDIPHFAQVHIAASGGNLNILKWLIEVKKCTIANRKTNAPLLTQSGLSMLAIAAQQGHVEMIRYLLLERGCNIAEIDDLFIAQRALHAAFQAPGPLPRLPVVKGSRALLDDLVFGTPASEVQGLGASSTAASHSAALRSATAQRVEIITSRMAAAPATIKYAGVDTSLATHVIHYFIYCEFVH